MQNRQCEEETLQEKISFVLNEEDKVKFKYRTIDVLMLIKLIESEDTIKLNRHIVNIGITSEELDMLFSSRFGGDNQSKSNIISFDYFKDIDLILQDFNLNKSWLEFLGYLEKQTLLETPISKRIEYRTTNVNKLQDKEMKQMYQRMKKHYEIKSEKNEKNYEDSVNNFFNSF